MNVLHLFSGSKSKLYKKPLHDLLISGWRQYAPPKCWLASARTHSIFISHILDVLTEMVIKSTIFWDITLATCFHARILLGLFDPEDGDDMFLQNIR
jgi:hypothetical protein